MKFNKKYLKSIIVLLLGQALLYVIVKFIQGPPHLIGNSFDANFPFIKHFVWIYNSWYPFLFISLYFLYVKDIDSYKNFFVNSVLSTIVAYSIFIIYPTTIERATFIVNDLSSFMLNFTYMMDNPPVNCLPSMHCIYCFTSIFGIITSKLSNKFKVFATIYFTLIILSTLFIKQHVFYDVLSALIITMICFFISKLKIFDKFKKTSLF